nr:MAG TPA: hypothetical protein [Caudoviricetes sp.]
METAKLRYILRDGEYYEVRIIAATEFQQTVADLAPRVAEPDELILDLHRAFGSRGGMSYTTESRYYYDGDIPSVVDVIVKEEPGA